jgi:hypothetical protein
MLRSLSLLFLASIFAAFAPLRAAESDSLVKPEHRLDAANPAWSDLLAKIDDRPDGSARFEERRFFPFKKTPTVLTGEVRVSRTRGLSLHYVEPDDRTVIIDERGPLIREHRGETVPPSDPRAAAANTAMLHLLRFNLPALAETFDIYGERKDTAWTLVLVPRADALRRTLGQITVTGENVTVRRIELRRSATQRIEILVAPPRSPAVPFTAEELRLYFR